MHKQNPLGAGGVLEPQHACLHLIAAYSEIALTWLQALMDALSPDVIVRPLDRALALPWAIPLLAMVAGATSPVPIAADAHFLTICERVEEKDLYSTQ